MELPMDLVVDHMLQPLIVSRASIDLGVELPSCVSVIQDLKATTLIAVLSERVRDRLDSNIRERRGVTFLTGERRNLTLHASLPLIKDIRPSDRSSYETEWRGG